MPWLVIAGLATAVFVGLVVRHGTRAAYLVEQTAAKLAEAHQDATHRAMHDATTGLPNRLCLSEFIGERLVAEDGRLALLYLDLDRFKPVNDSLGHEAGDRVLCEIADRFQGAVRQGDMVARLGGDEFVIALVPPSDNDIERLADRLLAIAQAPIRVAGTEVHVGVSIGVAFAPQDATTPDELLRCADIALYQAKTDGRGAFRFFASEMNERIVRRRTLETDLRGAIERGEFVLHYQPRFEAGAMTIRSFEALVRWDHPERGLVLPAEFIPVAEETGLIVPLGEWVLRESCSAASRWEASAISVNVSPAQFRHGDLAASVRAALERSGLPAHRLELELTEGVLLEDTDRALQMMNSLKDLGVRLSLDDFGTGFSSLGYLRAFPFDGLKIDRSFVADLDGTDGARAIIRAIRGLGAALGISVTAEGVETQEQLSLLRAELCDEVQGFLLARPMSAQDAEAMLVSENAQPMRTPAGERVYGGALSGFPRPLST